MKGKKLKELINISSFTVTEVAKRFGITREHLYQLYKKDDIGAEYTRLAGELGLTEHYKELHSENAGLSASQWMKMWEEEKKGRESDRALFERVLTMMEKDLEKFRDLVKIRN